MAIDLLFVNRSLHAGDRSPGAVACFRFFQHILQHCYNLLCLSVV